MRNIRHIFFRKAFLLALLLFVQLKGIAQVYPVQTVVSTSGPYFNYLSYYADENNHLQAIVTLTDFSAGAVDCRLRITIEGPGYELKTNPNIVVGTPFTLTPGVPNFINGIDLAPYLQPSNLLIEPNGINIDALPEGFTTICVDVIRDGVSQEVLSTNNCTGFFLQKFQPAQALLPACGSTISTDGIFHTFHWAPPIGYVPSIGSELNYTFSLYEWNDPNNFNIFETGQGLVYSAQTTMPLIQLSCYDLLMQPGKTYVWRIESQITSNGLPVDMIVNNGVSAPCTFTYGEPMGLEESLAQGLVINLSADATGERKGNAYWMVTDNTPNVGLSTYDGYVIGYRKKPTGSESFEYEWIKEELVNNTFNYKILQLEPNTTYEVFVRGTAGSFISDTSNIAEFTTFEERVYACGDADMPYMPEIYTPLDEAEVGMSFQIGQFTLKVTSIDKLSTPGHFKGTGLVSIPFLAGANAMVRFDNILVDDEFRVREGDVDVMSEGVESWLHEQYKQFIDPIYVNGTIDSVYVDDNGVAWAVVDGIPQEFPFDPIDYPIVLHDENGNSFTISPNGDVATSTYFEYSDDQFGTDITANDVATFEQDDADAFGFDAKEHIEWHENYEIIKLSDESSYFVANKSMAENKAGTVKVKLPPGVSPTFTIDGASLSGYSNGILTLPTRSKGEYEVHVLNANAVIGKLNLFVYSKKERNVVIVPMTNAPVNQGAIETTLKRTLGEANIEFNITVEPQFNNDVFTETKTIELPEDVGLMNKYSQEMRDLFNAYKADENAVEDIDKPYYVFVVPGFSEAGTDGYMMRGRSLGFVQSDADPLTYAHELGHGIGALEHTWNNNGPEKGSTRNLMDYVTISENLPNENLTKAQWKELRDMDFVPSLWDAEEDASSYTITEVIPNSHRNNDETITCLSAGGTYITLPKNATNVKFFSVDPLICEYSGNSGPIGTVSKFTIKDDEGVERNYKFSLKNSKVNYLDKDGKKYEDKLTKAVLDNINPIVAFPFWENGQFGFNLYQVSRKTPEPVEPYNDTRINFSTINGMTGMFSVVELIYGVEEINAENLGFNTNEYVPLHMQNQTFSWSPVERANNYNPSSSFVQGIAPEHWKNFFDNNNGTPVKGKFNTEISDLGKSYLHDYRDYLTSNVAAAPIIISNAIWITHLETMESYIKCYLPKEVQRNPLDGIADAFGDPGEQPHADYYNVVNQIIDCTSGNKPLTNAQKYYYSDLGKAYRGYRSFQHFITTVNDAQDKYISLNSQIENANPHIEDDVQKLIETLNAIKNHGSGNCLIEELTIDNRIKAIEILEAENEEKLIIFLITTTTYNAQASNLVTKIFAPNPNGDNLFEKLWSRIDDIGGDDNFTSFINKMLELTILSRAGQDVQHSMHIGNDIGKKYTGIESKWKKGVDKLGFTRYYINTSSQITSEGDVPNQSDKVVNNYKYDDLINVTFTGDNDIMKYAEGEPSRTLVLPAFYLSYLIYERDKAEKNDKAFFVARIVGNLAAIATAIPTGGQSITLMQGISVAIAATDIIVSINEDHLEKSQLGQDFLDAWDVIGWVDAAAGIPDLVKGIYKWGTKAERNFQFVYGELNSRIANDIAEVKGSGGTVNNSFSVEFVSKLRVAIKKLQNFGHATYSSLLNTKLVARLEAEVVKAKYTQRSASRSLIIEDEIVGKVSYEGHKTKIFDIKPSSQGAYIVGKTNITSGPLESGEQVVGTIKEARFQKGSTVKDGDLIVVEKIGPTGIPSYRVLSVAEGFIAKSAAELKTHLNEITNFPAGKTYNGNMYRSIGNQYNNPLEIHSGAINSNYRYSKPGEGGLYLSKTQSGNITEISHYGDISDYNTYEYANVQIDNMLDLTDDFVMQKLGVDFDLLTKTSADIGERYEFTHEIGTWASNNGYKGLIVPGARGNKDYINTIIFKQADVDAALNSITPNIINN